MSKLSFGLTNRLLLVLAVSCTPFFVACDVGSGDGEKVMGAVTFNGDRVEHGAITFKPHGSKSSFVGATISEGKYEAIVPRGKSKVEIRVPVVVGQEKLFDTADSPVMDVTRELLPAKYHDKTELEIEVLAGANTKDWELIGKKKPK